MDEYGHPTTMGFDDSSIRRGFIRKVYGILFSQLLITFAFICIFVFGGEPVDKFLATNSWLLIVAIVVTFVLMIVLACCESVRRAAPANYILLFTFTVAEGFMLGVVSNQYDKQSVLIAVGLTALIVFLLTMFSFSTKIDVTGWGCGLCIVLLIFTVVGIVAGFFMQSHAWKVVYAGIGAAIFCLYIIYDTQIMMGGNHKYALSPEEYVFASLNLYLDIINLFLYILQLIASNDS